MRTTIIRILKDDSEGLYKKGQVMEATIDNQRIFIQLPLVGAKHWVYYHDLLPHEFEEYTPEDIIDLYYESRISRIRPESHPVPNKNTF